MNNILLICPDTPENIISLTPSLSILKRNFPLAKISVCSPCPWFFKNNPSVNAALPLMGFRALYHLLKEEKYDLFILTKPNFKYALAAFLARIPKRIAPHNFYTSILSNTPVKIEEKAKAQEINLNLLKPLFIFSFPAKTQLFTSKQEDSAAGQSLELCGITEKDKFVCVFPGAKKPHLNASKDFYGKLIDKVHLNRKDLKILLIAAQKEEFHTVNEIFWRCIKKPAVIRQAPSPEDLTALIKRSEGICGAAALPAHIAAALGKKSIIFAPFKAEDSLCMPPASSAIIRPKKTHCAGLCAKECPTNCLKELSATQAFEVFDKIFTRKKQAKTGIFNDERTLSLFDN